MARDKLIRRLRRPFRNFLLGLGVFGAVAASGVVECGTTYGLFAHSAQAGWESRLPLDVMLQSDGSVALIAPDRSLEHMVAMGITAVVLSGLLAFNLWFAGHLRRVAISYRRRPK